MLDNKMNTNGGEFGFFDIADNIPLDKEDFATDWNMGMYNKFHEICASNQVLINLALGVNNKIRFIILNNKRIIKILKK
jgi:hypothetical protein